MIQDAIVLVWVAFVFFGAIFFVSVSILQLFQNKKIGLDKGFLLSLSACLVAAALCIAVWPPLHHVYDDELDYISQSVNILGSGKANIILKGSRLQPEAFDAWTANTKFPGFAWLEAITLFLTGNFEHSYFILNIILGTLSVAVVYRIAWLLTASHTVAWWSAIFMACLPARISYSMSAASDIAGLFFLLLFFLFIAEYRIRPSNTVLYAALFSGVYSICIRPLHGIFVVLGLAAALHIYRREGRLDKRSHSQMLLSAVCLFLPVLIGVPFMVLSDSKAGAYSPSFMFKNFYTSISYLFDYKQNTLLTTLAASAAVIWNIFHKKDSLVFALAGWFLAGLLIISAFCAGGISYPGAAYSDRYILSFALPFVLLAGRGVVDIVAMGRFRFLSGIFFIILVVNASYTSHNLAAITKEGAYYKKTLLLERVSRIIPDDAYIIEECAALVAAKTPRRSVQTTLFLKGDHPGKVVFLKGIYDLTDAHRTVLVKRILRAEYNCRPLAGSPFQGSGLSAMPLLCTRK